ncbi:MAG: type II toxin-antitoxin system VapC family toxin [Gammaproteobacteria bacterium]|nr:type II toxin-antitoxin system VapC family toxin [Gammaproteobacteria bacterium]
MRALLDTHIWVWWLTGDPALTARERTALDSAANAGDLCLAAISLWEAQMLHARGRLSLPVPFPDWLQRAAAPPVVTVLPLDVQVVTALAKLPGSFHGDPADRLIVATARAHQLPLATHDTRIRASRTVRIWKP